MLSAEGAVFRVQCSVFSVQGAGCRQEGSGCRVQGSGFGLQGSELTFKGLGFRGSALWKTVGPSEGTCFCVEGLS